MLEMFNSLYFEAYFFYCFCLSEYIEPFYLFLNILTLFYRHIHSSELFTYFNKFVIDVVVLDDTVIIIVCQLLVPLC